MRATASRVLRLAAMLLCLAAARAVQQNLHVEHEGRTWQWSELVRALDGYITIVDRGRHSRFWNFMAAWYQDPDALAAAAVEADDGTATMDEGGDDDDAEAAANLAGHAAAAAAAAALGAAGRARRRTPSTILVDDWVALWIMGKSEVCSSSSAMGEAKRWSSANGAIADGHLELRERDAGHPKRTGSGPKWYEVYQACQRGPRGLRSEPKCLRSGPGRSRFGTLLFHGRFGTGRNSSG